MRSHNIGGLDTNAMYKLATQPDTPPRVAEAAKLFLQNTDTFNKVETGDWSFVDGVADADDFERAATGQLKLDATPTLRTQVQPPEAMTQVVRPMIGQVGGQQMSAADAAGTLAAHMRENNLSTLDPNAMYKLAAQPGTPPHVADAAKFFLNNPEKYKQLETADAPGADGISGIGNFQKAAMGQIKGLDSGLDRMSATDAAGTLAAHMRSQNLGALDVNALYKLATGPDTPPRVAEAAKFFLQNPAAYKKLETDDVAGADGISGIRNFEKAAAGKVSGLEAAPDPIRALLARAGGRQMSAADAAGTLAAHMRENNLRTLDPAALYKLATQPGTPPHVADAAKLFLNNPEKYKQLETADAAGADGISGIGNFQKAAMGQIKGLDSGRDRMSATDAAGTLAAHMRSQNLGALDINALYKLASSPDTPPRVADAAKFFLQNPAAYKKMETDDVAGADGISGIGNFEKAAAGKIAGLDPAPVARPRTAAGGALAETMRNLMDQIGKIGGDKMSAADAAGTLAAHMREQKLNAVDANALYKLASQPGTPPRVADAAKFYLQNPEAFKKVETNDVAGVDGISGIRNFEKAAQGQISNLA